jgi:hypothetical protein
MPKLSDVKKPTVSLSFHFYENLLILRFHINIFAKYHPTLFAEIAGWGSTVDAGPKPYKHVPVEIVAPGDVQSVSVTKIFN